MKKTSILLVGVVTAITISAGVSAMPGAEAWEIGPMVRGRNYSVGMPANPRPAAKGALAFDFPLDGRGQIYAMTTAIGRLAGATRITLRYRIEAAPRTRIVPLVRAGARRGASCAGGLHNDRSPR